MSYDISGTVTYDASGLQYVLVQAVYDGDVEAQTVTAVDGTYTIADVTDARTYTVIPTRAGYGFTPTSEDVAVSGGNETGVDFAAAGVGYGGHAAPGSAEIELALGQPPILRVQYRGEADDLDEVVLGLGTYAEVDSTGAFGGSVESIEEVMPAGRSDARYWDVTFVGWEERLRRRKFIYEFPDIKTVQDIVDYMETHVLEEATGGAADPISVGTIEGGATEIFYPSFIYWTAADTLDYLADLVGGYWYIEPWPRVLNLIQYGSETATWALSTSQDVWNIRVRRSLEDYYNMVYVTTRTSWDLKGTTEYAVDATGIEERLTTEGGSGRYEVVVNAPSELDTETEFQDEADALLARYKDIPWEITYDTHETDLRPGMEQTVNLETEFGLPNATTMLVERVIMRQKESGDWLCTVSLTGRVAPRTWERDMRETLIVGQRPRTLPGATAMPRYLRP